LSSGAGCGAQAERAKAEAMSIARV